MAALARMLVVWCPDWPVTAAGAPPTRPVAVLHSGRVVGCSAAARAAGVRHGQRRREAQACCPGLELVPHDPDRDASAFETVLVVVESLTPRVEAIRPGECAFRVRGAVRHHGDEITLAATVARTVDHALGGGGRCRIGVADGRFAASLAARHGSGAGVGSGPADRHAVIPAGGTAGFLAPFPVAVLERPELTDMFIRLGLTTLGHLAVLPRAALAARFGPEGVRAHRLASGADEYPRASRRP
ncbi:MAG TPA: DNA polymerase Y family protein, partial [Actinomycetes bacterium]|nr:DNA polymerase Y family protein [Actinomycetes bacterium]